MRIEIQKKSLIGHELEDIVLGIFGFEVLIMCNSGLQLQDGSFG
jgi:hypothetical protein